MKFTATALALIGGATFSHALPFWGTTAPKPIPELTVQDWQSIHNPIDEVKSQSQPQLQPHSIWSSLTSLSPFSISNQVDTIESILEDILSTATETQTVTDDDQKTIWQQLNEDEEKYSKIIKLLKLEKTGKAIEVLDDRDAQITFFAPENSGFPQRREGDEDEDEDEDASFETLTSNPTLSNLLHHHELHSLSDKHDEERKKIFQFILRSVLMYHGLSEPLSSGDLAGNSTVATVLKPKFGANDGEALRIHLQKTLVPPTIELNFYSKVVTADQKAKNGYFHTISYPLIPPPSLLTSAFLFPDQFSTLTSSIQKIHGEKFVDWNIDVDESKKEKKPIFEGSPAVTLFAPSNAAFALLPPKLKLFLFSPFGTKALAAILAYHVVPKTIIFTEHVHYVKDKKDKKDSDLVHDLAEGFKWDKEFDSLLGKNGTLKVHVEKTKLLPIGGATKTTLTVNGVPATAIDVPAINGVGHKIDQVLVPPHHHHHHKKGDHKSEDAGAYETAQDWEDWEDWLMDWTESANLQ